MTPAHFFPELRPWVENLVNVWPAYIIKPNFAWWQVLHILSLVILGGTTILLNLRLIGTGLTEEPPSEIERNLRFWLNLGVVGVVITGILIGMANAERLYDSAAFTVKMVGLLAAIIFTYGATLPTAKADGVARGLTPVMAGVGLLIWAFAMWVFATTALISPGMFHLITALGLLALFVLRGRLRWIYLGGLGLLIAAQSIWTHGFIDAEDLERLDPVNKGFAYAFGLWIAGCVTYAVLRRRPDDARPLPQLIGYVGILMWVSVAAAGRWIAFA